MPARHLVLRRIPLAIALALTAGSAGAADSDVAALLQRLERLEQRLDQVEAENKDLRDQLQFRTERIERVEQRAGKSAQPGVVPTYASVNNDFTFKVRGVAQADVIAFSEDEGGYDYNSGTALRRARLGFEGDAYGAFKWRIETDFSGNAVGITDAYIQYVAKRPWVFTFGQHKTPFSLESNTSDNYNTFLERGIFNVAAGNAGAERRIGVSAFYGTDALTFGIAVTGDNESSTRAATSPDEGEGVNARVTWAPLFEPGHVLQVGAAGFWRHQLKDGTTPHAFRLSDRPGVRVDGGNLADTGVIRDVDALTYFGTEAVYVRGPFSISGEYGVLEADRRNGLDTLDFDGGYAAASWFLTGESRPLKAGSFDRLKPLRDFAPDKDAWGAWELVLRYDTFDFSETPIAANVGNEGSVVTAGINWYLNPNLKLLLNVLRFEGDNTPLDPVGNRTRGDAVALRAHLDW